MLALMEAQRGSRARPPLPHCDQRSRPIPLSKELMYYSGKRETAQRRSILLQWPLSNGTSRPRKLHLPGLCLACPKECQRCPPGCFLRHIPGTQAVSTGRRILGRIAIQINGTQTIPVKTQNTLPVQVCLQSPCSFADGRCYKPSPASTSRFHKGIPYFHVPGCRLSAAA